MNRDRLMAMSETVICCMFDFQNALRNNENALTALDAGLDKILEMRTLVDIPQYHRKGEQHEQRNRTEAES